ncbi:hypothetical protein PJS25_002933 [Escherichia coli]|nr:hypothetical protein [Escherichia coli]HEP0267164.1 hypothetical protein [Escherichia coli]
MDFAVIFFWAFSCIVIFLCLKSSINNQEKMQSLLFIFLLLTGGYLSSHIFNTGSGKWLFTTIVITFLLYTTFIFLFIFTKAYFFSQHVNKMQKKAKEINYCDFISYSISQHEKCPTYVLYAQSEKTVEICYNIFNVNPVIGKKLYLKTLSNRHIRFTVKNIILLPALNDDFICTLESFYNNSDETKDIIDNYIRKIQGNQQLPWLINNAVPTDTKEK